MCLINMFTIEECDCCFIIIITANVGILEYIYLYIYI